MNKEQFQTKIQSLLNELKFDVSDGYFERKGVYMQDGVCAIQVIPYPVEKMRNTDKKGLFDLLMTIFPLDGERSWVSNIKLELFGQTTGKISEKKTDRRGQTWFQDVPAGEGYRVQVQKPLAPFHWLLDKLKDWQPKEEILATPDLVSGFRGMQIDKAKQISLGANQTVAIVIESEEQNEKKFKILISLRPLGMTYLPENLKLEVILETGEHFEVVAKTGNDIIYLKDDNLGKRFHVVVQLNDISVTVL
jgi:hypothetical protein